MEYVNTSYKVQLCDQITMLKELGFHSIVKLFVEFENRGMYAQHLMPANCA